MWRLEDNCHWKLTYLVRNRNDTRSYHVFNIDETYIEGCPCLDDLIRVWTTSQAWTRLSLKIHIWRWGNNHDPHGILYSMSYCSKTSWHYVEDYSRTSSGVHLNPRASCGAAMFTHKKSLFNTKYKLLTKQSICAGFSTKPKIFSCGNFF